MSSTRAPRAAPVATALAALLAAVGSARAAGPDDQATAQAGVVDPAAELARIRAVTAERNRGLESLFVRYGITSQVTGRPADVKKYLGVAFCVNEEKTVAIKGAKRYARLFRPTPTATDMAPEVTAPGQVDTRPAAARPPGADKGKPNFAPPVPGQIKMEQELTRAFNGQKLQQWYGDDKRIHLLGEQMIQQEKDDRGYFNYEYLITAFAAVPDAFYPAKVTYADRRLPDALDTATATVRPATEPVDGAACVVVELGTSFVLWCDPRLSYAVRRWLYRDPKTGAEKAVMELKEFRQVYPKMWLPAVASYSFRPPADAPAEVRQTVSATWTMRATELHANDVPDSLFDLPTPVGTKVVDLVHTVKNRDGESIASTYTVPAEGADLDAIARKAQREMEDNLSGRRRASAWSRRQTFLIAALAAAAVAAAVGGRWYATRAGRPPVTA